MTKISTLGCELSSAEICRRNGWQIGTVLLGLSDGPPIRIRITAVGEGLVAAVQIAPEDGHELVWELTMRDWREVDRADAKQTPGTQRHGTAKRS